MPKLLWSESFGKRASRGRPSSKVTIFARADIPGRVFIKRHWIGAGEGKRREEPLPLGTTRPGARKVAHQAAVEREARIVAGRTDEGRPHHVSVRELLAQYHGSRQAAKWGEKHSYEQSRWRKFWELRIGQRVAEEVSSDLVERLAAEAREKGGWTWVSERKAVQYLKSAGRWGATKGDLFPRNPWEAVELPAMEADPDREKRIYSPEEITLLVTPHERVDWRVTLVASIEYDTGRRTKAIRHLWRGTQDDPFAAESDFQLLRVKLKDGSTVERLFLHFRAPYDKGKRDMWVPVSDATRALVEQALDRTEVRESGWLLPGGRLDVQDDHDKPIADDGLIKLLKGQCRKGGRVGGAERVLGIPDIRKRAFHAVKKRHVTTSDEEAGGDLNLVGDLTGNRSTEILKNLYRFPEAARMVLQVDRVRGRLTTRAPE